MTALACTLYLYAGAYANAASTTVTTAATAITQPLSDTECFFNWAEKRVPEMLTPHLSTQTADIIRYRGAYSSGVYLGVMGSSVLGMGGALGTKVVPLGEISSFLPTARAANCGETSNPVMVSPPQSTYGVQPSEIVAAHNALRTQVGVAGLTYSDTLAAAAQAWANELKTTNNCDMEHSNTDAGENLYWASAWSNGPAQDIKSADVVNAWAAEKANYIYSSNTCTANNGCGHYTQMVWKNTTSVGCGMAVCNSPKNQVWVCQYAPAGNYDGEKPY